MARVNIFDVGTIGIISDLPDHTLPPEAWTDSLNVRFLDTKVVRFLGEAAVMDPPTVAPAFVMSVEGSEGLFWIYASAIGAGSKVYVFNSGTHTDISKAGDYNVPNFRTWQGTVFQGTPI